MLQILRKLQKKTLEDTLPSPHVNTLVERRLQAFTLDPTTWLNMYAPSGSNPKHDQDQLFSGDVSVLGCQGINLPTLAREGLELPHER